MAQTGPAIFQGIEHGEISIPQSLLLRDGNLELFPEVTAAGFFSIRYSRTELTFQAGGVVGVIPVNPQVSIDVRPRAPIANLQRMLELSQRVPRLIPNRYRHYISETGPADTWSRFLSDSLVASLQPIRYEGLFKRYKRHVAVTVGLRGRILIHDTVRRRQRRDPKVVVAKYQRTANIEENQLIRGCLRTLHAQLSRSSNGDDKKRAKQLSALDRVFGNVDLATPDARTIESLIKNLPPSRDYYKNCLRLARTILDKSAVSVLGHVSTGFVAGALVLDVALAFEGYVRRLLQDGLSPDVAVVDGNVGPPVGGKRPLLADKSKKRLASEAATPDILIFDHNANWHVDAPKMVADCKYKIYKGDPERESINQVLTYALTYGAKVAVIVFPAASKEQAGAKYLGHADDVALLKYGLDLDRPDFEAAETQVIQNWRDMLLADENALVSYA